MIAKLHAYIQLMRIDKPIGTLLVLWPTLWALFIAGAGKPQLNIVAIFIVGAFLMRSAGCAINDFADRKVDGHVERTKNRPLPSGSVSSKEALLLFIIPSFIAFTLVLSLNTFTLYLSLVALSLAFIYPFMKRITHLPQLVLGLAFSWGIPMAFAAQANELTWVVLLLVLANVCWTVAYDTLYAMVDREDDLKVGIKSTAILFGQYDRLIIALLQGGMLALLAACAYLLQLNLLFYFSLVLVFCLFVHQHKMIQGRDTQQCFRAFLHNNYVGMTVFVGILAAYYI